MTPTFGLQLSALNSRIPLGQLKGDPRQQKARRQLSTDVGKAGDQEKDGTGLRFFTWTRFIAIFISFTIKQAAFSGS